MLSPVSNATINALSLFMCIGIGYYYAKYKECDTLFGAGICVCAFMVLAFTTASTAACIPLMTKLLKDDGVDDGYRDFALPFSQTVVKTGEVIGFSVPSVSISLLWTLKSD